MVAEQQVELFQNQVIQGQRRLIPRVQHQPYMYCPQFILFSNIIVIKSYYMKDTETIGAIRVTRMIWTSTLLSLGAIFYCWANCDKTNPSIMTTGLEYPYTIVLRVGLMYSLFIMFLVSFFIKWWIDGAQKVKHTTKHLIAGLVSLAAYGLFVSTLDRKRINYVLAEWAVFVAAITNFIAITGIFRNIKAIRQVDPYFVDHHSWRYKKVFYTLFSGFMLSGVMIYFGQMDISLKNKVEYGIVISSYLFYWSFIHDFKGYTMDIDNFGSAIKAN